MKNLLTKLFTLNNAADPEVRQEEPAMVSITGGYFYLSENSVFGHAGRKVNSFEIAKYATTNYQWLSVMGRLPASEKSSGLDHPVVNVSWNDIHEYISCLNTKSGKNYRLVTNLEWEYAARAGVDVEQDYYFSSENLDEKKLAKMINYGRQKAGVLPVGSLPPNPWGLHEMLGNVWEWVDGELLSTILEDERYRMLNDNEAYLRGGSWKNIDEDVKLNAYAVHNKDEDGFDIFGFRLARSI